MMTPLAARSVRRTGAIPRSRPTPLLVLSALAAAACGSPIPVGPAPSVQSVVVSPGAPTLLVGDSVQLTAAGLDADSVLVPTATFRWASNNPAMTSVSATGMVKALTAGGPVNITATAGTGVGTAVVNDTTATP